MIKKFIFLSIISISVTTVVKSNNPPKTLFPNIEGWTLHINEQTYTPDNLWDIINGAADLYLSYDFRQLDLAEYKDTTGIEVRVELYHHNTLNNAFGIYAAERMPDYDFIEIGAEGYVVPGALNFFSGSYYVKIMSVSSKDADTSALFFLAEQITLHLNQENKYPDELNIFPEDNKKPYTEKYSADNFLGYSFLYSAFTAEYKNQDEYKLFVIHLKTAEEAKSTLEKYLETIKHPVESHVHNEHVVEDPFNGKVFISLHENYLLGVLNLDDENKGVNYLQTLNERIQTE